MIEAVAALPIGSIRELIGALNRLIAYQAVSDTPISSSEARTVLAKSLPRCRAVDSRVPPSSTP